LGEINHLIYGFKIILMSVDMKNILMIATGGTISMKKNTCNELSPSNTLDDLLSVFPKKGKVSNANFHKLMNIDSSNILPEHWIKIAQSIYDNYEKYNGFIITHGTDTMTYTASALSFALRNLSKPIVLTGAIKAPQEEGSDAKENIINSIEFASSDLSDVCICFDGKLYRGNRAKKVKNEASKITNEFMSTFSSINYPLLGEINGGKYVLKEHYDQAPKQKITLHTKIDTSVASLKLFPGFNPKMLENLSRNLNGVLIEAFGPGNAPFIESGLLRELKNLVDENIAVVIATQCPFGEVDMAMYETGKKLEEIGVISAKDMSSECALVKLMFGLGENRESEGVREFMHKNIAGELNPNR
jgi:L-asparaginase